MTMAVIIIGAGGHAKVLIDVLRAQFCDLIGLTDMDPAKGGVTVLGVKVIGDDTVLNRYPPETVTLCNGIVSIGPTDNRREVFNAFKARGYSFASVCHASAVISTSAILPEGVQV